MNGLLNLKSASRKSPRKRGLSVHRIGLPGAPVDPQVFWKRLPSPWRFWFENPAGVAPGWRFGGAAEAAVNSSWFAFGPPLWTFQARSDGRLVVSENGRERSCAPQDPVLFLKESLAEFFRGAAGGPFPAQAGAVGFWGYESARYFDPACRINMRKNTDDFSDVVFSWSVPSFWARLDGQGATLWCLGHEPIENLERKGRAWAGVLSSLSGKQPAAPSPVKIPGKTPPSYIDAADFEARARRVKNHIARGDIYQANLSHKISLPWTPRISGGDFFAALCRLNPSPYGALMEFPGWTLASGSPEILLRVNDSRIETRPIAGTRPRGATRRLDRRLSGALLLSPKERAEHIMLLDLERNDVGRVCRPGSVRVTEKMTVEKYSHVSHIVSQVEGVLKKDADGFAALRSLFPGGTITGCPKIECMKILSELENEPRGPFYGSAGWIAPSGDMELNLLIRTAVLAGARLFFRVGAGIVADSHPAREWQETWHKARAILGVYQTLVGKLEDLP